MFDKPLSMVAISIVVMMTTMMKMFDRPLSMVAISPHRARSPPSPWINFSALSFRSLHNFHQNMDSEGCVCVSDAGIIKQTQDERQDLSSFWLHRSMLSSRSFFFFVIAANSSFNACSLSVTWPEFMFIALQYVNNL